MEVGFAKRENPAKKREAGGVRIMIETACAKATNIAYEYWHASAYNSNSHDSNNENETYILCLTEHYCRKCKQQLD